MSATRKTASPELTDVNVWLGHWPFQLFAVDTAGALARLLDAEGITRALVSAAEAAFLPDCAEANALLARRLKGSTGLIPVPVVNPAMGNWRDVLLRARDAGAPAVKLLPGYHCYGLGDACSLELLEELAREPLGPVMVQLRIEDERAHHPLCRIPGVDCGAVIEAARRFPSLVVVALCPYFAEAARLLAETENVCVDLSFVEHMRTVGSLLDGAPGGRRTEGRVLFGSHTPFLYTRAATLKLDAPDVPASTREAIASGNASRILGGRPPAGMPEGGRP